MRINYNKEEDAMYIRLSDSPYAESDEMQEGVIFDLDASGAIIGIELLDASKRIPNLNVKEFKYEVSTAK